LLSPDIWHDESVRPSTASLRHNESIKETIKPTCRRRILHHKEDNPAVANVLYLRALEWGSDVASSVESQDESTSLVSKQLAAISAEPQTPDSVADELSRPVVIAVAR
jgi:hypothetical protein